MVVIHAGANDRNDYLIAIGLNFPRLGAVHTLQVFHIGKFFLNFLLKPARPISPVTKRSIVAGSGTGDRSRAWTLPMHHSFVVP